MYSARHAAAVRVVHSVASAAELAWWSCALHAEPPASSLLPVNCCTALQGRIILYNPKHRPRWTNGPPIGVPKLAGGWRSSAYHYAYRQAAGMHDVSTPLAGKPQTRTAAPDARYDSPGCCPLHAEHHPFSCPAAFLPAPGCKEHPCGPARHPRAPRHSARAAPLPGAPHLFELHRAGGMVPDERLQLCACAQRSVAGAVVQSCSLFEHTACGWLACLA